MADIDTLEERREVQTEWFFRRIVTPENCHLHYMLPNKRGPDILTKLRCPEIFEPLTLRTQEIQKVIYKILSKEL